MIVQLDSSNRVITGITIAPASEEYNRLEFYPNAMVVDSSLITEDPDLYEILDGQTPTLIEGWEAIKIERQNALEADQAIAEAIGVRMHRNGLLSESDWTQVADAPVNQTAWATYRQALRDVPAQEGFPNSVVWPTEPE